MWTRESTCRLVLWGLVAALALGCTRANPAFRGVARNADDGAALEDPPGVVDARAEEPEEPTPVAPDAAATPDLAEEPDLSPIPDLGAVADLAVAPPDLLRPSPDLSPPPPDLPPPPPDLPPPPIPDLIAHLRFDEATTATVAADATNNMNTGRVQRGAAFVRNGGFPTAKFSNLGSLTLDGQDDYLDITNRNLPRNEGAKTVSVWFKAVNPAGLPIRTIVSLSDDTSDDVGFQVGLDTGRCAAWVFGSFAPLVAGKSIDTSWHHLAVTYQSGRYVLYCDGTNVTPLDGAALRTGPVTTPRVGTWKATEEMFQGLVDDLRIYGRALTAAEVRILAGGGE